MKPINSDSPKRFLLLILRGLLLFLPTFLFAQVSYPPLPDSADWISASLSPDANYWEIREAALDYFAEYPDHPDFKNFGRWSHFWESRVGDTNNPGSFQSALDGWSNLAVNCFGEPEYEDCQEDQFNANWQSLGPNSIDQVVAIGRIQSMAVDPHSPTFSRVYAGAASGGLFRTEDINANVPQWDCLTCDSNLPMIGVFSIAIDPVIEEDAPIYIAAGFDIATFLNFGAGFYRSLDDGETWERLTQPGDLDVYRTINFSIVHHPAQSNILFATAHNRVYKTVNGGNTWEEILAPYAEDDPPSRLHLMRDIVFHPEDPDIIYVSSDDQNGDHGGAELFISMDGGDTWSERFEPFSLELVSDTISRMDIAVTPSAQDTAFLSCVLGKRNSASLLKYDISSGTWSLGDTSYNASWNMNDIVVDPTTSRNIYVGHSDRIRRSTNFGNTFDIGITNGVHVDNRDLEIQNLGEGDVMILSGNDGGVGMFVTGGVWENKNGVGLNVAQFYGLGASLDGSILAGGAQDICILELVDGIWSNPTGSPDGGTGFVDPYDPLFRYVETWNFQLGNPDPTNGLRRAISVPGIYNDYYDGFNEDDNRGGAVRPLAMDSRRRLYIGLKQVIRRPHEEPNETTDWEQLREIEGNPVNINALAIASSREEVVFIGRGVSDPLPEGNILVNWDTGNPMSPWDEVEIENVSGSLLFGNAGGGAVRDIVVDPRDAHRIWFCTDRFDRTYKVVMLEYNPNTEDWVATNVSEGLCDYPVHSLVYQIGSNHAMYAGTEIGVFFNPDASDPNSPWVCFNDGMPPCIE